MIDRAAVEADAYVKVDLLGFGDAPRAAAVKKLRRTFMIVFSDIFREQVRVPTEFPLDRKRWFRKLDSWLNRGKPGHGEHAHHLPMLHDG